MEQKHFSSSCDSQINDKGQIPEKAETKFISRS